MFIQIKNLKKSFDKDRIKALRGVNLELRKGEFVAIMGPSGCGKSTLMNMIGALDKANEGEIIVDNKHLEKYKDLSYFRAQKVGYIFQLHNLIPTLTVLENIQMPMFEDEKKAKARKEKAKRLLELVGLKDRDQNLPTELSGGERQRVAVARALANDPEIIIADEPTGALDSKSAQEILELLQSIHAQTDKTIIMVTHNQEVAARADRIITMRDGIIQ